MTRIFSNPSKMRQILNLYFKKLHKRAVEQMLEAELDTHLDTEKHQRTKDRNYRHGYISKKNKNFLWGGRNQSPS